MKVYLKNEKRCKIKEEIQGVLSNAHHLAIDSVARILGLMVSSFPAVQYGRLHYRDLEMDKTEALKINKGNYKGIMSISQKGKENLQWWLNNIEDSLCNICQPPVDIMLYSDASLTGWGLPSIKHPLLHFEDNSKDQEGSCRRHFGGSRLVNPIMVPSSSVSPCPEANIPTTIKNSAVPPNLSECNAPTRQENETTCSINLLLTRDNSCQEKVLSFLTMIHEDGLSYSSVNTAKSALSSVKDLGTETPLDTEQVGGGGAGRPRLDIPKEVLENSRCQGFSWTKISKICKVSRWTIMRRVADYNLTNWQEYSKLSDEELDSVIIRYISNHGRTTGKTYVHGHLRSIGCNVQRWRVRESINRVDPKNSALRWGALVARRVYSVPWPNSLWHIDGHHSLIRWGFVIHGCIDGFSRRIMFLCCSTNNLATTVLNLFEQAISNDGGLWPSRICVDFGVENVSICDAIVAKQGVGRNSYIAGSSTRNQRIERLWRDVFRCVINAALSEWVECFNNHPISTEHGWSPNQLWTNGMMNEHNPLAGNNCDDSVTDGELFGEDPQGPSPFEQSDNNVIVSPVEIPGIHNLSIDINSQIDVLRK
eukprot:gene13238-14596_t